jgi:hypothetical protein
MHSSRATCVIVRQSRVTKLDASGAIVSALVAPGVTSALAPSLAAPCTCENAIVKVRFMLY